MYKFTDLSINSIKKFQQFLKNYKIFFVLSILSIENHLNNFQLINSFLTSTYSLFINSTIKVSTWMFNLVIKNEQTNVQLEQ